MANIDDDARKIAKKRLEEISDEELSNLSVQNLADKYNDYKDTAEEKFVTEVIDGVPTIETSYEWLDSIKDFDDYEEIGIRRVKDDWLEKGSTKPVSVYRRKDAKASEPNVILKEDLRWFQHDGELFNEYNQRIGNKDAKLDKTVSKSSLDSMFIDDKIITEESNVKTK